MCLRALLAGLALEFLVGFRKFISALAANLLRTKADCLATSVVNLSELDVERAHRPSEIAFKLKLSAVVTTNQRFLNVLATNERTNAMERKTQLN